MQINKEITKIKNRLVKVESFIKNGALKGGKLVKCDCGHSWITRSPLKTVSCPSCGSKIRISEKVICNKCKKELSKSNAIFGYNSYFHKDCFKTFNKGAKKEVSKGLKKIL